MEKEVKPNTLFGMVSITYAALLQSRDFFITALDMELQALRHELIAQYDDKFNNAI